MSAGQIYDAFLQKAKNNGRMKGEELVDGLDTEASEA